MLARSNKIFLSKDYINIYLQLIFFTKILNLEFNQKQILQSFFTKNNILFRRYYIFIHSAYLNFKFTSPEFIDK